VTEIVGDAGLATRKATLGEIFRAFLLIGATSFGGGVMAYLRSSLVDKRRWIDDSIFVQMRAMSQSLPGLNSTNMAVLVGDRLRGTAGAAAAICGLCLPGGLIAFFGPTGLLTLWTGRLWRRLEGWRWREPVQRGLAPVSVGLLLAGSISLAKGALTAWTGVGLAAAVFALLVSTRINPAFLALCGAVVGLFVFSGR
jgi:chromate transporter